MIELREGRDLDVERLRELRRACGFADRPEAELRGMIDGAWYVVSAWDGARLVGFARALSDGVSTAYVSSVMVDAAYRRRGVGRGLMERLMAGRGHLKFVLHARPEARAFYAALGFSEATDMYVRRPTAWGRDMDVAVDTLRWPGHIPGMQPRPNLRALAHPVSIGAVALLALNDHVLKGAWPGWWTGKLSDFAFCVVAPLVLAAPFGPRARIPAILATGVAFAVLQLWPPLGAWFSPAHVADAADLVALPFLLVPLWLWRAPARDWGVLVLPAAALSLLATGPSVELPDTTWPCNNAPGTWNTDSALLMRIDDHGPTNTDGFLRGVRLLDEDGEEVPLVFAVDDDVVAFCAVDGLAAESTYTWEVGPWEQQAQEASFSDHPGWTITFTTARSEGTPVSTEAGCSDRILPPSDGSCSWGPEDDTGSLD